LFVTHQHIAPREEIEQFAIPPQVAPVLFFGPAGFDDEFCHLKRTIRWGALTVTRRLILGARASALTYMSHEVGRVILNAPPGCNWIKRGGLRIIRLATSGGPSGPALPSEAGAAAPSP